MVESTIFLPIETPSEQREAPPCSSPLCYNLFIKVADSFCPWQPTVLPSRGKVKGSNVQFPHWASWCFKHSAVPESPPGAQRGPHHIQFVKEPWFGTIREAQGSTDESYTTEVPSPLPSLSRFHCLFFYSCGRSSQQRPDLWLLSSVTSCSPQRVESLWTLLPPGFRSVWSEAARKRKVLPHEIGDRVILQYYLPQPGTSGNILVCFATVWDRWIRNQKNPEGEFCFFVNCTKSIEQNKNYFVASWNAATKWTDTSCQCRQTASDWRVKYWFWVLLFGARMWVLQSKHLFLLKMFSTWTTAWALGWHFLKTPQSSIPQGMSVHSFGGEGILIRPNFIPALTTYRGSCLTVMSAGIRSFKQLLLVKLWGWRESEVNSGLFSYT